MDSHLVELVQDPSHLLVDVYRALTCPTRPFSAKLFDLKPLEFKKGSSCAWTAPWNPAHCKIALKEKGKYQAAITMGMLQCFETKGRSVAWRKVLTAAWHYFLARPEPEEYLFVFKSIIHTTTGLVEGELPPPRFFTITGGWELLWASILCAYIQWQTNGPTDFYVNHFRSIVVQVMVENPDTSPLAKIQAAQDLIASTSVLEDTGFNKAEQYLDIVAELKAQNKPTTMPEVLKLLGQVQYVSKKESWANLRTLQEVKALATTFVLNPEVLATLRKGGLCDVIAFKY